MEYERKFEVEDIPADQLTHLAYAFALVKDSGIVDLSDAWADTGKHYPGDPWDEGINMYGHMKKLYQLKKKDRGLKTILPVGGWNNREVFAKIVDCEPCRASFATSAVRLMYDHGFDGLEVDYEFVKEGQQANWIDLLAKIRAQMNIIDPSSPFILSADLPAGPSNYQVLPIKDMLQYLDIWNLMAYDYAGSFSDRAYHASNLIASPNGETEFDTATAIDFYLAQGVPASKLNVGIPLYGHRFLNTDGIGKSFQGVGCSSYGESTCEGGNIDYHELPIGDPNFQVTEDLDLGASYSYNAGSRTLISYDTPKIAEKKAQYIMSKQLGGAMYWDTGMLTKGSDTLIHVVNRVFGNLERSRIVWITLTASSRTFARECRSRDFCGRE
ncbi:Endochitinase B1 [Lachnellula suecica]|uniref:chitinase n=1 Tax=Lachnellula suecica TaxID=602035 RepID=A0A8T9CJN9_9HELO|nr:Endochitinase B1 [Lachnellula suecica]